MAKNEQEVQTIQTTEAKFGDVVIPVKADLAFNGEARSNKDIHNLVINVNLKGVAVETLISKALAQRVIDFRSSRRSKDSSGVFETREAFDEYCEGLGNEVELHFNAMGNSPTDPHKAEQEVDANFEAMSPEAQMEWLEKKMASIQK